MEPQHCLELNFGGVICTHNRLWLHYVLNTAVSTHVAIPLETFILVMETLGNMVLEIPRKELLVLMRDHSHLTRRTVEYRHYYGEISEKGYGGKELPGYTFVMWHCHKI